MAIQEPLIVQPSRYPSLSTDFVSNPFRLHRLQVICRDENRQRINILWISLLIHKILTWTRSFSWKDSICMRRIFIRFASFNMDAQSFTARHQEKIISSTCGRRKSDLWRSWERKNYFDWMKRIERYTPQSLFFRYIRTPSMCNDEKVKRKKISSAAMDTYLCSYIVTQEKKQKYMPSQSYLNQKLWDEKTAVEPSVYF